MADIHAVLFDVDDTLVDTRGAFRHALAAVAGDYLGEVDHGELLRVWREDQDGFYRAHTRGELSYREQRHRRANALHAIFGGPTLDDAGYDVWNTAFERAFRAGWAAHPDAAPALDALAAAGVPFGGLSNARHAYQVEKLAAAGLSQVPMLVGVDTLGFGKPDPRVFTLACERLGFSPAQVAYVGDEFDVDAAAAVAAGLAVGVWIERDGAHARDLEGRCGVGAPRDGLVRVASLAEVPAVLGL